MIKRDTYFSPKDVKDPEEGAILRAGLPKDKKGEVTLSEQLSSTLALLVREGNTLENAARVCGLRRTILDKWLKKGKDDVEDGIPSTEGTLARTLDAALGDQERTLARIVFSQSNKDPRLALDVLGRRRPESWAPALPEAANVKELYRNMSREDVEKELKRLLPEKKDGQ